MASTKDSKLKTSVLPGSIVKQRQLSANEYLSQLATALMVDLTPEQTALYLDDLQDLSEERLAYAFKQAKRRWKPEYGRSFPSIPELLEFAREWRPDSTRALLERGDKPPDWTPMTKEESAAFIRELQGKRKR